MRFHRKRQSWVQMDLSWRSILRVARAETVNGFAISLDGIVCWCREKTVDGSRRCRRHGMEKNVHRLGELKRREAERLLWSGPGSFYLLWWCTRNAAGVLTIERPSLALLCSTRCGTKYLQFYHLWGGGRSIRFKVLLGYAWKLRPA